jgi:TP901 family phage tail tape measure protein
MARERLIIEITEKGARRVQRRLGDVGRSAKASLSSVTALKGALATVGAGMVLHSSIRTLASFGQEMSTVAAITGATGSEFEQLTERAKQLGATTRFTATEAGTAMVNLSRAGFSAAETMVTVGDTLLLAQAGAVDLGTAASITTATLRGFQMEASEASHVVDVLAVAANSANTDVVQLGEGMKLVAPISKGLGISLEETTAALGKLSDSGLQATLAGTGLRKIMATLADPSGEARREFEKLNVSMDDIRKTMGEQGLAGVVKLLRDRGVGVTEAFRIFGIRGAPAFNILAAQVPQLEKLTEKLKDSDGAARDIAAVMDDNLNGALLKVKSAIESVILAFSEVRGGTLQKMFEKLAGAIRFLGENVEILQGAFIGLAVTAIPAVIAALVKLFLVINAHPFMLLGTAIGVLIGWIFSFRKELKLTEDGMADLGHLIEVVWDDIKMVVGSAVTAIKGFLDDLGLDANATWIEEMGKGPMKYVRIVALAFDSVLATARGAFTALVATFQNIPNVLGDLIYQGANAAIRGIEYLINEAIHIVNEFVHQTEWTVNFALASVGKKTKQFGRIGVVSLGQLKNPYQNAARELGGTVSEAFKIGFKKHGTPIKDYVENLIPRAEIKAKQQQLEAMVKPITEKLVGAMTAIQQKGLFGAAVSGLQQVVPAGIEAAQEGLGAMRAKALAEEANKAAESLDNMNKEAFDLGEYIDGQFNQGLKDAVRNIADLSSGVSGALTSAFNSASDALSEFALSGFQNIEDLQQAFSDLFRQLAKDILNLILKMLLLKALQAALGGTGLGDIIGGGGGAPAANAAGGPVTTGTPTIVGERGPELFVPPSNGNIVPNSQMAGAAPQVTVVNVQKEDQIPAAMNSPQGHEVIMNFITQNRDQVRRVLS